MDHNKELSYVMTFDLSVDEGHQREALNHILQLLQQELKVPYNGVWPLDFHSWDRSLVEFFAEQSPDLMFYIRKD